MAKRKRCWPEPDQPLGAQVMDNHTHLPLRAEEIPIADGFQMPLDEQLALAEQAGVSEIITVGCSLPDFEPTVELTRHHRNVKAALAIHPNEAALHAGHTERSPDGFDHQLEEHHVPLVVALERLAEALDDPHVVAVGETGLDYFRTGEPGREAQAESFEIHLELARAHDLPLQIHDREAHEDTLRVLRRSASRSQAIVFHSFSGDAELARHISDRGWYASFSGPLTYPANGHLREAFLEMPRELVLVETDAPYLPPVPYRGSPNASYVMTHTVRAMAELWEETVEETARILMENSCHVYRGC